MIGVRAGLALRIKGQEPIGERGNVIGLYEGGRRKVYFLPK
jgi:hypothetical protein